MTRVSIEGVAEARIIGHPESRARTDCHVACIVLNAVFLLVGGLMLFIDDDEPEIAEGQEERGARAGRDAHQPIRDADEAARAPRAGDA